MILTVRGRRLQGGNGLTAVAMLRPPRPASAARQRSGGPGAARCSCVWSPSPLVTHRRARARLRSGRRHVITDGLLERRRRRGEVQVRQDLGRRRRDAAEQPDRRPRDPFRPAPRYSGRRHARPGGPAWTWRSCPSRPPDARRPRMLTVDALPPVPGSAARRRCASAATPPSGCDLDLGDGRPSSTSSSGAS